MLSVAKRGTKIGKKHTCVVRMESKQVTEAQWKTPMNIAKVYKNNFTGGWIMLRN